MTGPTAIEVPSMKRAFLEMERDIKKERQKYGQQHGEINAAKEREWLVSEHLLQSIGTLASFNPQRLKDDGYRQTALAAAALLSVQDPEGLKVPEGVRSSKIYAHYNEASKNSPNIAAGLKAIVKQIHRVEKRSGGTKETLNDGAQRILDELSNTQKQLSQQQR